MGQAQITILGDAYAIQGDAQNEYIQELGLFLDERMKELRLKFPSLSLGRLSVLAAINILDECIQKKIDWEREKEIPNHETARRTQELISLLDEGLMAHSSRMSTCV